MTFQGENVVDSLFLFNYKFAGGLNKRSKVFLLFYLKGEGDFALFYIFNRKPFSLVFS